MKTKIFRFFLPFATVSCSVLLWQSVDGIAVKDAFSSWFWMFVLIFVNFSFFIFNFLLLDNKKVILSCIFSALFASLFFAYAFSQVILIFIAGLISLWVYRTIYNEKKMIVKIELFRVLRPVKIYLIIMMSLIISGQFYNNVISHGVENLAPGIEFGKTEKRIIGKIISIFDQSLNSEELEEMTVDEFILRKANDAKNNNLPLSEKYEPGLLEGAILERGVEDFSSIVGRQVSGDEKIFDIFSEVINNRVNEFFQTSINSDYLIFVPWTIFIMLFLMTFSVISFLMPFIIFFAKILFAAIKIMGLVRIEKISVQKEVIKL